MAIIITKKAMQKIVDITKKVKSDGFIFYASSGGCNGFNYKLKPYFYDNFSMESKIKPRIIEHNDGKVLIDPLSEMYLMGTTVDYVSENYDMDIYENKFVFKADKNFASTCGCGTSFNPNNI